MHIHIRIFATILFFMVVLWVVFMAISMAPIEPGWTDLNYLHWAAEKGTAYLINYINVTLLTALIVLLFAFLYIYLNTDYPRAAMSGLIFVPVYGVLNLVSYSIQISLVPGLAGKVLDSQEAGLLVAQLIQANPDTLIGYLNGLAYAILAIPSIIYGIPLFRTGKRFSGLFLLINGILCLLGIIGYLTGSYLLSLGIVAGGIVFLFSLFAMAIEFRKA